VNFIDEFMTIDASKSYDPDNSSSVLTYSWTCPSVVTALYVCNSLSKGSHSSIF